ncbi:phage baseplate assembly protein [Chitinibacteraceae bacterium HSL-7]
MSENLVRLTVNGYDFSGWKEVSITAGIERVARDFSLLVTYPRDAGVPQFSGLIRPHDECEVFIGSDKVLTGFVDGTPVEYDGESMRFAVNGRSLTGDLVDCSAIGGANQWRAQRLEQIAAALAAEYGVKVVADVPTGEPVADFAIEQGETVFEAIDRLLKSRQFWASDDEHGVLRIIKAGSRRAGGSLVLGENILQGAAERDYKQRFSEYRCKGQQAGTDDRFGDAANQSSARSGDALVRRRRVLLLTQSGQASAADCQRRVRFEHASRYSQSLAAQYTVQGWRSGNGVLWQPNQMVRVVDPVIGFDADLLIIEVTWSLSAQGMKTQLKVAPVDGWLDRDPEIESRKKKAGRKGGDTLPDGEDWTVKAPK